MTHTPHHFIEKILLDPVTLAGITEKIRNEREVVIADLIAENSFILPQGSSDGPYALYLSLSENRLIMDIEAAGQMISRVVLPLKPLRAIVRDYFFICESYDKVVQAADPRKIEAIDMGRRGLHNEGSELLKELLEPEAIVDFDTARRLFSLICVLHMKG